MLVLVGYGIIERFVDDTALKADNDRVEEEMKQECREIGEKSPIFDHLDFHEDLLVYDTESGFIYDFNRYMRFLYGTLKRKPKPVKTVKSESADDILFFLDLLDPDNIPGEIYTHQIKI